jgi:hypothetical protein
MIPSSSHRTNNRMESLCKVLWALTGVSPMLCMICYVQLLCTKQPAPGLQQLISNQDLATEVMVLAFFGRGFGRLELDPVTLAGPRDVWSCFSPVLILTGFFGEAAAAGVAGPQVAWSCFFPVLILTRFFGVAATAGASESSIIIFRFSDGVRFLRTPDKSCTSAMGFSGCWRVLPVVFFDRLDASSSRCTLTISFVARFLRCGFPFPVLGESGSRHSAAMLDPSGPQDCDLCWVPFNKGPNCIEIQSPVEQTLKHPHRSRSLDCEVEAPLEAFHFSPAGYLVSIKVNG